MTLDDLNSEVSRSVWETKTGSKIMTVSGLLDTGKYKITKEKDGDRVILECVKQD